MYKIEFSEFEYGDIPINKKRELEHNIAYSMLDRMLCECGICEYEILKNENGKPYLKDNSIHFNISHTNGFCAVCINDSPVGLDCEKIDHSFKDRIPQFAKRYFLETELELLKKTEYDTLTFFKIWTRKEAYIKKFGYNASYITKVDTTKEDIETIVHGEYIISIFK